jgi:U4/U6.U5 tri-snRNP-associated protein 2
LCDLMLGYDSLSHFSNHACIRVGKWVGCVQGRGQQTHAYTHSLETNHHMFMKLDDARVYCLPDGYEVVDRSLDIIRFVLNPSFTPTEVRDNVPLYSRMHFT